MLSLLAFENISKVDASSKSDRSSLSLGVTADINKKISPMTVDRIWYTTPSESLKKIECKSLHLNTKNSIES